MTNLEKAYKTLYPNAVKLLARPGTTPDGPDQFLCRNKNKAIELQGDLAMTYQQTEIVSFT